MGFDPGTTAALAVVDLRGSLVLLRTFRGGLKEAVSILRSYEPAVVASDKKELEAVRKLAAAFGAVAFFPEKDLSVAEKKRLAAPFPVANDHERDALAAALNAYRKHRRTADKVLRVESALLRNLLLERTPNIKAAISSGRTVQKERKKRSRELGNRVKVLEGRLLLAEDALRAERARVRELMGRKQRVVRHELPMDYRQERSARVRLERELMEAHSRISRIEGELEALKRAKPEEKENIRERILRMLKEYRERFRR